MSFIKKAVKRVFRAVRKIVKKVWKPLLIIGATVLTAGLATVGFAGFSSAMAAAGGGVGGFFSAVGSTMMAGGQAILGSLGIGKGVSANVANAFGGTVAEGTTLFNGALAQSLGAAGPGANVPGVGQQVSSVAGNPAGTGVLQGEYLGTATQQAANQLLPAAQQAAQQGGQGFFSTLTGQRMLWGGIGQGARAMLQQRQAEAADRERRRRMGNLYNSNDYEFISLSEAQRLYGPQSQQEQPQAVAAAPQPAAVPQQQIEEESQARMLANNRLNPGLGYA